VRNAGEVYFTVDDAKITAIWSSSDNLKQEGAPAADVIPDDANYQLTKDRRLIILNPDETAAVKLLVLSKSFVSSRSVYGSQKQFQYEDMIMRVGLDVLIPEANSGEEVFSSLKKAGFRTPSIIQGLNLAEEEKDFVFKVRPDVEEANARKLHGSVPIVSAINNGKDFEYYEPDFYVLSQHHLDQFQDAICKIADNPEIFGKNSLQIGQLLQIALFQSPQTEINHMDSSKSLDATVANFMHIQSSR